MLDVIPFRDRDLNARPKLESPPRRPMHFNSSSPVFGIFCSTLALSSLSSSGPAGGASDGYGLGRGAAGPGRRCTTTAVGALRVIV